MINTASVTEPEWTDSKWVRVMADFSSDGVWAEDGCSVSAEDLPITDGLRARLMAWQHRYDRECEDYLPEDQRTKTFDPVSFSAEGKAIAKAIKAELPDWTVIYFDEARLGQLDRQYEIHND